MIHQFRKVWTKDSLTVDWAYDREGKLVRVRAQLAPTQELIVMKTPMVLIEGTVCNTPCVRFIRER